MTFEDIKNIQIQDFSTSSSRKTFLLHYKDVFLETGSDVVELLTFMQKCDSENSAIEEYIQVKDGKYSREMIQDFLFQLKMKLEPSPAEGNLPKGRVFLYQKELISPAVVANYTSGFRFLFNKGLMTVLSITFILLEIYFFLNVLFELNVPKIDFGVVGGLVLFFVLSSLIHELGHASACKYFGISSGGIGFGLYINIPVFYTDVSHIWKLPRRQRCVVNLAGVYFQSILLIPFLVIYMYTYSDLIKYIIFIANLNFFVTLNPFFKFDGYWLMTDLLGIPNLRKKGNECIVYFWKRLKGKQVTQKPYLFLLNMRVKVVFIIYTTVVNLFFSYYFLYILPLFLVRFCETFPYKFRQLLSELLSRQMPDWLNLQQLVVQILFLSLTIYMIYRVVEPLLRKRKESE